MLSVITSALPTIDKEQAFTFSIISLSTSQATPDDVQKWQIGVKKFALKTFRDFGIENKEVSEKDIEKACKVITQSSIQAKPRCISSFNFKAGFIETEEVAELIELDKTFVEKF